MMEIIFESIGFFINSLNINCLFYFMIGCFNLIFFLIVFILMVLVLMVMLFFIICIFLYMMVVLGEKFCVI